MQYNKTLGKNQQLLTAALVLAKNSNVVLLAPLRAAVASEQVCKMHASWADCNQGTCMEVHAEALE